MNSSKIDLDFLKIPFVNAFTIIRTYKPVAGASRRRQYSDDSFERAIKAVQNGTSIRKVAASFSVESSLPAEQVLTCEVDSFALIQFHSDGRPTKASYHYVGKALSKDDDTTRFTFLRCHDDFFIFPNIADEMNVNNSQIVHNLTVAY